MRLSTVRAIASALEDAEVRYIVVGGVAVNAHGYQRLTQDLDLVLSLAPGVRMRFLRLRALIAMKEATGRPRDTDDAMHLRWILEEREGK